MRLGLLRTLLVLTLFLGAVLAWMWFDSTGKLRNLAWTAPKAILPEISLPAGFPAAGASESNPAVFSAILERPIFAPDRRPPPPPAPPVPAPPPDPLATTQIYGIFVGENAGILARVDGKMRRIKLKDAIGPWTLDGLEGRDIVFKKGEESRKLRLAYAKLDTPRPQAVVSPPRSPSPALPNAGMDSPGADDATRERIKKLNEYRAGIGLPPISY